jgi:hypothetical protein
LKLLPYLHALIEVDKGAASLDATTVSWVSPTIGTTAEKNDTPCLDASAANTVTGSAVLKDALPTMMWESHNRTLDAILNKYGPANITRRGQSLGLRQTEMYFGCPQPGGPERPWADNVSTLSDFARIFEQVEALDFVAAESTRQAFRDNMMVLDAAPGTSYSSPITGRMSGPMSNEFLRPLVEREAGSAKSAIVSTFMKHVVIRKKGGSGGPSGTELGNSDFLEVSLPFRQVSLVQGERSRITAKTFVVGWYICQMRRDPTTVEKQALETFRLEIHAEPIRQALASW